MRPAILCILILSLASGCMSAAQQAAQEAVVSYYAGDYVGAKKLLEPIARDTNEDFVLNNVRLGSSALAQYDLATAEAAFLRAYEVINSVGVNNGGRSLGAALVDEKIKVWKGEPFERAMANFYLGQVYYMQGDYNNARAAFENALFKLRDYTPDDSTKELDADKYRDVESNFTLGQYMLARSLQRLGQEDRARAAFAKITALRPGLSALANYDLNLQSNLLLVIDYGTGPHKVTDADGSIVGFAPVPQQIGPPPWPGILIDGQPAEMGDTGHSLVDLVSLAQDRRWQSIDTIRAIKSVVGTGLIVGGAYELTSNNRSNEEVGAALLLAGILLKATSQADVRVWEMLPRSTYVVPLTVPPGTHDVTVRMPGSLQTWKGLIVPSRGEATYYFRMVQSEGGQYAWPPATLTGWPAPPPPSVPPR